MLSEREAHVKIHQIRFRKWSKNPDGNITRDVKLFCMLFKIVIVSYK